MKLIAEGAGFVAVKLQRRIRHKREVLTHLLSLGVHKEKNLSDRRGHEACKAHQP